MVLPQKSFLLVLSASFVVSGALFWYIPYEQAALLEFSFYWKWLVAVALIAGVAAQRSSLSFSDCVMAAGMGPAAADIVRIVIETAADPTKHNLWPFELVVSACIGAIGALVGTALPGGALGLPSNMSSFRTMEFDGRLEVINAGSSYPRQNASVPSPFWASECNTPVALGALDFFERGEVITVRVQPTHVNNPAAGNVGGDCVFPVRTAPAAGTGGWPFVEGQYDAHEGICTVAPATLGQNVPPIQPSLLANDSVSRLPSGILTVAWEGYRIIQPVGPVG